MARKWWATASNPKLAPSHLVVHSAHVATGKRVVRTLEMVERHQKPKMTAAISTANSFYKTLQNGAKINPA